MASTVVRAADPAPADLLSKSRRIVFLGDSITAAGQYVAYFDAWLVARRTDSKPEIIDAGLPSETVSGLSEEGHAGGKFPRPDLAERLDRVLAHTNPDLVIACYGINCGIYEPFDEGRFARYQDGIRSLKAKVEQAGARCIFMTPPFYDDQRAPKSFSYDDVLDRYSDWLLERRKEGWLVIDLHRPMSREVRERRAMQPEFTYQPDGVHPNPEGHWLIARQLIGWFGDEPAATAATAEDMLRGKHVPDEVLPLVQERVNVLRDAYVFAAGHKRPGVVLGLPVEEAERKAAQLAAKIAELLENAR
jgi:lysophospholipase L1-like esterase